MKRDNSLDALRILACFQVIMIHISSRYVDTNINNYNLQFTAGNFYESLCRMAVPLFVMLSGAFLLDNSKNKDYSYFYKKTKQKIIKPTLLWSSVYIFYEYILLLIEKFILKRDIFYFEPLKNWMLGKPYYHLWYMYMIIGIYLLTPIMIRLKEELNSRKLFQISIFLILIGMIVSAYQNLLWIIQFILYLGYFLLGYSLKKFFKEKKEINIKIPFTISIMFSLCIFLITEILIKYNLLKTKYFYNNLSIFVIISSIFMFVVFLNFKIKGTFFSYLSGYSFDIYLMHAGVLSIVSLVLKMNGLSYNNFNGFYFIPILSIFIFVLTYAVSNIMLKIKNIIKMTRKGKDVI